MPDNALPRISPQQADDFADDGGVVGFAQGDGGVVGVLGLKLDAVAVPPEALDCGFLADAGGDNIAVLGGLLGLDNHQIPR